MSFIWKWVFEKIFTVGVFIQPFNSIQQDFTNSSGKNSMSASHEIYTKERGGFFIIFSSAAYRGKSTSWRSTLPCCQYPNWEIMGPCIIWVSCSPGLVGSISILTVHWLWQVSGTGILLRYRSKYSSCVQEISHM